MQKKPVELLAPAGSWDALEVAINAGADAIYVGGTDFGARQYASNFGKDELTRAVRLTHLHSVRLYVTVNTLASDEEFARLKEYLLFLEQAGVDGIIVQDLGIADFAHRLVPTLPLYASTQMTITNSGGVDLARSVGFTRVVLARECSLREIKKICASTGTEIEVFIHGALCISYSGQCLMSSLIGGRSGNRGRCAQPCRLPYTLLDGAGQSLLQTEQAGQYLLSPRDLNTLDILPALLESGVVSYKIEGRMKRPEYVAVVVDIYRRAIDSYYRGEYFVSLADQANIRQIFNRDFTTGFMEGNPGKELMSDRRPNNRGVLLGRVLKLSGKGTAQVKLDTELNLDDEVEFWVKIGGRSALTVKEIKINDLAVTEAAAGSVVSIAVPLGVKVHDRVFRVLDAKLMAKAASICGAEGKRRIPLTALVTAALGGPLTVTLTDDEGNSGSGRTEFLAESARKHALTEDAVRKQINRLGSTEFVLQALNVELGEGLMVPVSEINEARRQAVESLEQARLKNYPSLPAAPVLELPKVQVIDKNREKTQLVVRVDTVKQAEAALQGGADYLLCGGDNYAKMPLGEQFYREMAALAHKARKKIAFITPRIVKESQFEFWTKNLEIWRKIQPDAVAVANNGLWQSAAETGLPLWADWALNVFNGQAIEVWRKRGAVSVTLSPELTWQQIETLLAETQVPLECLVQGRLEMMVSEYCVGGSFLGEAGKTKCEGTCSEELYLEDRKGARFPLVTDTDCRMHVLNAYELSMLKYVRQMAACGVKKLRIDARFNQPKEIANVVLKYREVLNGAAEPEENEQGTTRGHYFRGVL